MRTDATSRRRVAILRAVIVLTCFCGVFGWLVGTYIYKFNRQLTEESAARLAEVSNSIVNHLSTVVDDTRTGLEVVAQGLALLESPQARLTYLNGVAKRYSFVYMGYAGPDGMLHATLPSESVDVSAEPWFKASARGIPTVSDQIRKIFAIRAASGILLAVPFTQDEGRGALVAMLETQKLQNLLALNTIDKESRSYIIDRHGDVLMRTRSMDFGNLFTELESESGPESEGFARFHEDVRGMRQGVVSFVDIVGNRQYVYYQPLSFNNWMAVTIVEEQVALSGKTIAMTRELALGGGGIVLLFMLLMYWSLRAHRLSRESRMAMDAKSAFLANMSHEIRTPMNVVVGLSEVMLRDDMPPVQRDRLASILNAGKGLLTVIDDILDMSKIEAGKFPIIEEPYALETVLNDVTTIAAMRIGNRPVQFWIDIDPSLPRGFVGDMGRVKQVLLNIVGNAIKFTAQGAVRLCVGGRAEGEDWVLRAEVRDTGIGIREEDLDKLFISFNQVDTRRNRNVKGTGLGLAISKKLCEMMRGQIEVSSVYGEGSTFIITLRQRVNDPAPLLPPVSKDVSLLICEESALLRSFESAALDRLGVRHTLCSSPEEFRTRLRVGGYTHVLAPRAVLRGVTQPGVQLIGLCALQDQTLMDMDGMNIHTPLFMLQLPQTLNSKGFCRLSGRLGLAGSEMEPMPFVSILIVDDNEINVQVAEGLMAPYGMKTEHAYSGREALQAVRNRDYDLVFMDHMMPEMDGVETTQRIRALPGEKYRSLPIVALTANVTVEMQRMFLENGFNAFLAKPIEMDKLNRLLRTWLKEINDRRAAEAAGNGEPAPPETGDADVDRGGGDIEEDAAEQGRGRN